MAKKKKFSIHRLYGGPRVFSPVLFAYHNEEELKLLKRQLDDYDVYTTFLAFMGGVNASDAYREFKRRIMHYYRYNIVKKKGKTCVLYGIRLSSDRPPEIPLFMQITKCAAHVIDFKGSKTTYNLVLRRKRPVVKPRKYNRSKIKSDVFDN